MPNWKRTVNIKDLLNNDASDEGARRLAVALGMRLTSAFPNVDPQMSDVIESLTDVRTLCDVNGVLAMLYDYGDEHRIWLGLL